MNNFNTQNEREKYNEIRQFDEEIQKRKTKRNIKLFLGVALVIMLMCMSWFEMSILDSLPIALIFSGMYLFSGAIVWVPYIHANDNENKQLENMKKEYEKEFDSAWY